MDKKVVFEAKNLCINAVRDDGSELPIVKDVNFQVREGEVVALIGESGSGKTTIALSSLGYCKPGLKISNGQTSLFDQDLTTMNIEELRQIRSHLEDLPAAPSDLSARRDRQERPAA